MLEVAFLSSTAQCAQAANEQRTVHSTGYVALHSFRQQPYGRVHNIPSYPRFAPPAVRTFYSDLDSKYQIIRPFIPTFHRPYNIQNQGTIK